MNQADALRRLEELEARKQQRDLQPVLERLAGETGFGVAELIAEAERLHATYGTDPLAIESGIAGEQGITIEQMQAEAKHVIGSA